MVTRDEKVSAAQPVVVRLKLKKPVAVRELGGSLTLVAVDHADSREGPANIYRVKFQPDGGAAPQQLTLVTGGAVELGARWVRLVLDCGVGISLDVHESPPPPLPWSKEPHGISGQLAGADEAWQKARRECRDALLVLPVVKSLVFASSGRGGRPVAAGSVFTGGGQRVAFHVVFDSAEAQGVRHECRRDGVMFMNGEMSLGAGKDQRFSIDIVRVSKESAGKWELILRAETGRELARGRFTIEATDTEAAPRRSN